MTDLDIVEIDGEPLGVPSGWAEISLGMSNFDHEVDDGFDEALRGGDVYGRHAGWNFNGRVWHADGWFYEQVWVYHVPVRTFRATDLRELMELVNDEYGWE